MKEVPLFKRYVMMGPFVYAFDKSLKKEEFEPITIPYREKENIYIICTKEKSVEVIYSIRFKDPDDVVFAHTFLQEFKDSRRDKSIGNAPPGFIF
jgi:hypothetical protein